MKPLQHCSSLLLSLAAIFDSRRFHASDGAAILSRREVTARQIKFSSRQAAAHPPGRSRRGSSPGLQNPEPPSMPDGGDRVAAVPIVTHRRRRCAAAAHPAKQASASPPAASGFATWYRIPAPQKSAAPRQQQRLRPATRRRRHRRRSLALRRRGRRSRRRQEQPLRRTPRPTTDASDDRPAPPPAAPVTAGAPVPHLCARRPRGLRLMGFETKVFGKAVKESNHHCDGDGSSPIFNLRRV